jgi:aldose sugar dehydrogenase
MRASTSHRGPRARLLFLAAALMASACGSDSSPPAPSTGSPPTSSGPINVTGTERIGWNQPADDASLLAHYQYLGFVDDVPQTLGGAVCGTTPSDGMFPCNAQLPPMTVGNHRLELAAQEIDGAKRLGPRSAALLLNVTSRVSALATDPPRIITTYDGIRLVVDTLVTGLSAPSALAVAPDGRVFVAGRDGAIIVWQNGRIPAAPALQLKDPAQTSDVGLMDMALDPEFASNGRVFVAYTARNQSGEFVHRVLRLRDTNNVFGQGAAILEERALSAPLHPPRIRIAADHTVYVALPAGDQTTAESYASYAGKMLRINQDGTTPRDNQAATPVLSSGEAVTGGFDWHPATGRLWLTGRDWTGRDFIRDFQLGLRGAATFETPVDPSGAVFYTHRRIDGFANDLFIGALNGRHLRRVHFSQPDPNRIEITEHLLDGQYGRISAVAVGPDGALYFCTSNVGTTSAAIGDDRLLRVTPARNSLVTPASSSQAPTDK